MDCATQIIPLPDLSPTVLVVEDNWQIARSIRRWLEDERLTVLGPAPTLAQAEKVLDGQMPDIAVVDLNLAGEFSYPLIQRLEAEDVKVIVITAYDEASRDLGEGAFVLEKPFARHALIDAVRERASYEATAPRSGEVPASA